MNIERDYKSRGIYRFICVLVIIAIVTIFILMFLIFNENSDQLLDSFFSLNKYIKPFLKIWVAGIIPFITLITTWLIHINNEEKRRIDQRATEEKEYNILLKESRPLFYFERKNEKIKLCVYSMNYREILIKEMEVYYLDFSFEILEVKHFGTINTRTIESEKSEFVDQNLYEESLLIVIKGITVYGQKIYFMHDVIERKEYNVFEENEITENRVLYDCIEEQQENNKEVVELVSYIDYNTKNCLSNSGFSFYEDAKHAINRIAKTHRNDISELHHVISLIRYYPEKFKYDNISRFC